MQHPLEMHQNAIRNALSTSLADRVARLPPGILNIVSPPDISHAVARLFDKVDTPPSSRPECVAPLRTLVSSCFPTDVHNLLVGFMAGGSAESSPDRVLAEPRVEKVLSFAHPQATVCNSVTLQRTCSLDASLPQLEGGTAALDNPILPGAT